ncbi:MAG: flavodoxin family protein [Christensenellaceae bacterium]|jgi:multimeric flavodoxin WrbA
MKTLIMYYSLSGTTDRLAHKLANEKNADLAEVKEQRKRNVLTAFFACPAAMSHKKSKIQPLDIDFSQYDAFILLAPIWAGHPAPPMNNMLEMIPAGKDVEVMLVSGGGTSGNSIQWITDTLKERGAGNVVAVDVKSADVP